MVRRREPVGEAKLVLEKNAPERIPGELNLIRLKVNSSFTFISPLATF